MKRTLAMKVLELEDPGRRPIQQILKDAYDRHGDIIAAAKAVGITQSCYSHWTKMLGGRIVRRMEFGEAEQSECLPLEAA